MLQSETQPVVLPQQKAQANQKVTKTPHRATSKDSHPFFHICLPRKCWLEENPIWLFDAGAQGPSAASYFTFGFFSEILYQAKYLTGFQLAQLGHRRDAE